MRAVVVGEWDWLKVWNRFEEITGLRIEEDYDEVEVQDWELEDQVKTSATNHSDGNFSVQSSVHIYYD